MGVNERKPKSGRPPTWCAQIRVQRDRVTVFSDSRTFEREAAARTRYKKKKEDLAKPGGLERAIAAKAGALRSKLGDAIDRLVAESERELKETKAQVLRSLREDSIADMACEDIRSDHIVDLAKRLLNGDREPSTVGNYVSHLSSVSTVARLSARQAGYGGCGGRLQEARLHLEVERARSPAGRGRTRQAHGLLRGTIPAPPPVGTDAQDHRLRDLLDPTRLRDLPATSQGCG